MREKERLREGEVAIRTGVDGEEVTPASGTRDAKIPDSFLLTLRRMEPTNPRGRSSSTGEMGGESSSRIVWTPFSAGNRMDPSLGPQSGPRNRERNDP